MYLWQQSTFSDEELVTISQSRHTMNLEALTTLGLFYAYGKFHYPQSSYEATIVLNLAMAKKHAQAYYVYAHLVALDFFKGVTDLSKSVAYLKKSAELGFDLAMSRLGEYYLDGKGVKQSYRDAEKWLIKARNPASTKGLTFLEKYYRELGYDDKANELLQIIRDFQDITPRKI